MVGTGNVGWGVLTANSRVSICDALAHKYDAKSRLHSEGLQVKSSLFIDVH